LEGKFTQFGRSKFRINLGGGSCRGHSIEGKVEGTAVLWGGHKGSGHKILGAEGLCVLIIGWIKSEFLEIQ